MVGADKTICVDIGSARAVVGLKCPTAVSGDVVTLVGAYSEYNVTAGTWGECIIAGNPDVNVLSSGISQLFEPTPYAFFQGQTPMKIPIQLKSGSDIYVSRLDPGRVMLFFATI